jgi:MinD-like ATPase involved in chromosome partitioning or flagellar assembly
MTAQNGAREETGRAERSALLAELQRMGLEARSADDSPATGADSAEHRSTAPLAAPATTESLTADTVLRPRPAAPRRGWRRGLYAATFGAVNPGPSPAELRERALLDRIRTPIRGCHKVAVISLKGGVGKTTTSAALGAVFASIRGDRVVAVDANPDRGTLGEKVPSETGLTVRDLLNARVDLRRYTDVREFTSQAPSRLEVLGSDVDPSVSVAFTEDDYRATVDILEHFYSLIVTDCGTGLLHSAMKGVLELADTLVLVSSPALDGARSASATLDWLVAHGYADLVAGSVTVISAVSRVGGDVDVRALEQHFASRCRAVVQIPYDPHLQAGSVIDLGELRAGTRAAYQRLAATVAAGFAG